MLAVLTWLLRGLLVLVVLGWVATWIKVVHRRLRPRWALVPEDPPASAETLVSVVIPARDEEANIEGCVRAVLAQDHRALQVVVLDDGSTDRTGEILASIDDDRLEVVQGGGGPLPEGWYGKPWALQRAQEHARGEWLVFIDADVRLHPSAVSRVVGYGEREALGMVTGIGTLVMESFWEKVLQPAVAGVILMGNDLDRVNDPARTEDNMASGQLIVFRREAYDRVGRHGAVQADILDDIGLARACVAAGVPYRCLFMRQLYRVRMYTSLREIWEGWSKNLFAGMHYHWPTVIGVELFLFVFTLLGPLLLLLALLGIGDPWWLGLGAAQLVVMQGVRATLDRIWGHSLLYGLTHAPATALVMGLMVNSGLKSRRGTVTWRGRTYAPSAAGAASTEREEPQE